MLHRRQFIQGVSTALGSLVLLKPVYSQTGLTVIPLADDMILITGAGENVLAVPDRSGLLLIDSGNEAQASILLATLMEHFATDQVNTLVNTHWHPDQTGLNSLLGETGTEIIAHENTRLWMSTEIIVRWQNTVYPPVPVEAQPTTTFYDAHALNIDGENVDCGYLLQAHTDGDIYVHFRERNVLMAGGALSTDNWPVIDWSTAGWIGGMLKSLDVLIAQSDENTIIVPATGLPTNRAELVKQREMYADIMAQLKKLMESGYDINRVIAETPTAGYKPEWGSPDRFLDLAFRSFWGHVRQFDVV